MKYSVVLLFFFAAIVASSGQSLDKRELPFNKKITMQLDSIHDEDQKYRLKIDEIENKFGRQSQGMKDHWKAINRQDSANLIKVTGILDEFGWLGPETVGGKANTTLFLVIQHSDQKTQEKYLPMMRDAVKNGKAQGSSLALLEDRVALAQGKKQIYGSQIRRNEATGKYHVAPIEDEANVNSRRASVGLEPLEEYLKRWEIAYRLPAK
jgi:hypothetical protein